MRSPVLYLALTLIALLAPALARGGELQVVRVFTSDPARIDAMAADADLWAVHPEKGVVILAATEHQQDAWRAAGLRVEPATRHQATLDTAQAHAAESGSNLRGGTGIPGFPCYRTVEETLATARALAASHPDLATVIDIGDSWEKQDEPTAGYDLLVLRLTNNSIPGPKPTLFVNTAIHAREYTTAELATRFAETLIGGYGTHADVTWILDHHDIHFLLMANPDGRKRAETGLLWRKNTNNTQCANTDDRGTDLNRNFTFQWGCCGGSSSTPCATSYRGPSPASEPEDAAIEAYVTSLFPDQRPDDTSSPAPDDATGILLDIHSFGEDVLWSWGFTTTRPPNDAALYSLGRKYAYFTDYRPQHGSLSTVDGSTKDFAYGTLGVPGFTIELGTSFFESCASFESIILPDNLDALLNMAKHARAPYRSPAGPDALHVAALPLVATPGDTVDVVATVDDTRYATSNGVEPSQPIARADLYLDRPPWAPGATPLPMVADDGAFDATVEAVTTSLDTSSLALGRHTLWVVGEDADGHRGAPSAAFLYILDPVNAPTIRGTVRDASTGMPLAASVTTGPFMVTSNANTGEYVMRVPSGTYTLTAEADGYANITVNGIVVQDQQTVTQNLSLAPLETVFFDDIEDGAGGWVAGTPWAITTGANHSPTHAWRDSPTGNYTNNADVRLTSPVFDFQGLTGTILTFWHRFDLEQGFDFATVEVSTGGVWTAVAAYSGTDGTTFTQVEVPVPQLDNTATARIRFRLTSDTFTTADGWDIDDIQLTAATATPTPPLFADDFESGDTAAWTITVP